MQKFINYIKDTRGELKHVSWPTKKQSIWFTVIVIIVSLITSFFLGFFDFIFSLGLDKFIFK
ncbi:MAG: preprotein translocase subunit SecE [Patescibacteria group bacterium]|nr:preprotein translocase subunit SecE [Patescibacteria group bacterium]